VSVPDEVLGLLADLRELLQNKMEPPVYVSDRRLVKAIALLKVRVKLCPCIASHAASSVYATGMRDELYTC
jgi:AAA lid domain